MSSRSNVFFEALDILLPFEIVDMVLRFECIVAVSRVPLAVLGVGKAYHVGNWPAIKPSGNFFDAYFRPKIGFRLMIKIYS